MSAFQVQVRGEWAGSSGGWRPACGGTINQTGRDDVWASTFDTAEEAGEVMRQMVDGGQPAPGTEFRVDEVSF